MRRNGWIFLAFVVAVFAVIPTVRRIILSSYVTNASSDVTENSIFCHVIDVSNKTGFVTVTTVNSPESVARHLDSGVPFVVRGVASSWPATRKWSHAYFREIFKGHNLFSSTFSTPQSPEFDDDYPNKTVYYGIFLNDQKLADLVAKDYVYPNFIPSHLKLHGNEWIHWGYSPCGAKRHVDTTCTGRISVQVRGSKIWRFYPLEDLATPTSVSQTTPTSPNLLTTPTSGLQQATPTLTDEMVPLEVAVETGDAVVWFPGWEHETRIVPGDASVSISLHFSMTYCSNYTNKFSKLLAKKLDRLCNWCSTG